MSFRLLPLAGLCAALCSFLPVHAQPAPARPVLSTPAQPDLYVADYVDGNILKVSPVGASSTFVARFYHPRALAFDTQGNLFVADYGPVSDITPPFTGTDGRGILFKITPAGKTSTVATGFCLPTSLVFDKSGNLFLANLGNGTISRITPTGAISTFASGFSQPAGLAFESHGDLLVVDSDKGTLTRILPGGARLLLASGLDDPTVLVPADNLAESFFILSGHGSILRLAADGSITPFAKGFPALRGLALAPDGVLFASSVDGGSIFRLALKQGFSTKPPVVDITTFAFGLPDPSGLAFAPASPSN